MDYIIILCKMFLYSVLFSDSSRVTEDGQIIKPQVRLFCLEIFSLSCVCFRIS